VSPVVIHRCSLFQLQDDDLKWKVQNKFAESVKTHRNYPNKEEGVEAKDYKHRDLKEGRG